MASDLTERLAAKLGKADVPSRAAILAYGNIPFYETINCNSVGFCHAVAADAPTILPLLLSEPELVASLPDEVRLSVLTPRERVYLRLGRAHTVLESECRYVPGQVLGEEYHAALIEFNAALAEARALTPEVGNVR